MEKILLAASRIVVGAGHDLHKGTPREMFVRDFLSLHLASNIGIGSGEIIDPNRLPVRSGGKLIFYSISIPFLGFTSARG